MSSRIVPGEHVNTKAIQKNIVSKDLQQFVRSLNLLQTFSFCPKYCLKDNFITPIPIIYKIISILANGFIVFFWTYKTYMHSQFVSLGLHKQKTINDYLISASFKITYLCCVTGFFVNTINNTMQSNNNVKLVLKIQKIMNIIKIDQNIIKNLSYYNWIYGWIVIVSYFSFLLLLHSVLDASGFLIQNFLLDIPNISFDINIFYAVRMLVLIKNIAMEWIKEIKRSRQVGSNFDSKMHEAIALITEVYVLFKHVFQDLILYYIFDLLFHTLINVVILLVVVIIEYHEDSGFPRSSKAITFLMIQLTKRMFLIICLTVANEKLFSTMEDTQKESTIVVLRDDYTVEEKRVFKNTLRSYKTQFKRICVRGLFQIDASLSISLGLLVTNYTLLFLQFALLKLN